MPKGSLILVVTVSALVGALVAGALIFALDAPRNGGGSPASAAALIPISSEPVAPGEGATVFSSVPELVNFQGVLTNPGGGPLPNATRNMTFRVYNDPTGGTLEWTEKQMVTTDGGLFQVLLGSVTPLTGVFDGTPRFLEVQVGTDTPLLPRQQFVSVPYAFHAATADSANTAKTAGFANSAESATTADSATTANKADLANDLDCIGCVDADEIAGGAPSGTQFGFASQDALTVLSSTSFADLSGMTVTINVSSDSIYLMTAAITADPPNPGSPSLFMQAQLDNGNVGPQYELQSDDDPASTPLAMVSAGKIPAGSHTWKIRWRGSTSSTIEATGRSLAVFIFPQ